MTTRQHVLTLAAAGHSHAAIAAAVGLPLARVARIIAFDRECRRVAYVDALERRVQALEMQVAFMDEIEQHRQHKAAAHAGKE